MRITIDEAMDILRGMMTKDGFGASLADLRRDRALAMAIQSLEFIQQRQKEIHNNGRKEYL